MIYQISLICFKYYLLYLFRYTLCTSCFKYFYYYNTTKYQVNKSFFICTKLFYIYQYLLPTKNYILTFIQY